MRIITYLNDGNGNYTAGSLVSTSIPDISWIELSDTDGDGDLDLFVASSTYVAGGIYWFKNFGNGTFGSSMTLMNGAAPGQPNCHQIILEDIDNLIDVLGVSETSDVVFYYPNSGSGSFLVKINIFGINESGGVHTVAAGDIDNDGITEVII